MIKVTVEKDQNEIKTILLSGHALYADYGKDIVCAGVSSILTTTINAILKYDENAITYVVDKNVLITVKKMDHIVRLLLENMLDLFSEMHTMYPKNITIKKG